MTFPRYTTLLLLLLPATLAARRSLRGSDGTDDSMDYVYKLKPSDLTDEMLKHLVIEHNITRPDADESPGVPKELSDDQNDPIFVFEGYLDTPSNETKEEKRKMMNKQQRMQEYWYSLDDDEVRELEGRLEKRRTERDRKEAAARGVPFDTRRKVAMTVTEDHEVWSLRMDEDRLKHAARQSADEFVGHGGSYDSPEDLPNNTTTKNKGIGLELRSKYNNYDMNKHPWSSQGCISISKETSGCFCTGTKISARLVLTAGHCLYHNGENSPANYWLPGADGVIKAVDSSEDDTPNGWKSISMKFADALWLQEENEMYDWGFFVLSPTSSTCKLGWFGYEAASDYGEGVNIFGYPGEGTCENSPFTSNECFNSLYGDSGQVFNVQTHTFECEIDTQGGMSGSGVYKLDGRKVVGVHVRSIDGEVTGTATRITDDIFDALQDARSQFPDSDC